MSRMMGKKAVVIGGTSGIGKAIVEKFIKEGASVVFCGRSKENGLKIQSQFSGTKYMHCDVTDKESIKQFFKSAIEFLGRIDIAVNNSGISGDVLPFHETSDLSLDKVMNTNFYGTWYCMQHEIKHYIEAKQTGCILNIASTSGLIGNALGLSPYSASKHAIVGLTKSTALEYAKNHIRINALCPGFVDTPMTEKTNEISKALRRRIPMMQPIGRIATTEEIANAALYICSDEASFTTGSCMVVDGGLTT